MNQRNFKELLKSEVIYVFGSNLAGIHGAGSAKTARFQYGAEIGVGSGRTGQAYAIPTKDRALKTLPLASIEVSIKEFLEYAKQHMELNFQVTKVGCGLAGYKEHQIAPMFKGAPRNCYLPEGLAIK